MAWHLPAGQWRPMSLHTRPSLSQHCSNLSHGVGSAFRLPCPAVGRRERGAYQRRLYSLKDAAPRGLLHPWKDPGQQLETHCTHGRTQGSTQGLTAPMARARQQPVWSWGPGQHPQACCTMQQPGAAPSLASEPWAAAFLPYVCRHCKLFWAHNVKCCLFTLLKPVYFQEQSSQKSRSAQRHRFQKNSM